MPFRTAAQRPHHLLWQAAAAGHVVIFCEVAQSRDRAMERFSERFYVCHNFDALRQRVFADGILYFTDPRHARLAGAMGARQAVYDVVEEATEQAPCDSAALTRANAVWVASHPRHVAVAAVRPDALYLPDGGEYEVWSAAPGKSPGDLAALARPRVVCAGAVGREVDLGALCTAARGLPEASFVLVGPVPELAWARVQAPPNVFRFGERPLAGLSAYAHAADALFAPLRASASAARVWDYLATGRPVVCTGVVDSPVPATALGDLVPALRAALAGDGPQAARQRRALAASNTWRARWWAAASTLAGA